MGPLARRALYLGRRLSSTSPLDTCRLETPRHFGSHHIRQASHRKFPPSCSGPSLGSHVEPREARVTLTMLRHLRVIACRLDRIPASLSHHAHPPPCRQVGTRAAEHPLHPHQQGTTDASPHRFRPTRAGLTRDRLSFLYHLKHRPLATSVPAASVADVTDHCVYINLPFTGTGNFSRT